jgi:Family of unknown function (DUF6262)
MTNALAQGRQADSAQRRQRVIKAINTASASGTEISVSAIARSARVDRTFLYRHRDLLAHVHAAQTRPTDSSGNGVSHASLRADLVNANERATRQAARIRLLENKLSELLGEQAWCTSGLGAPDDIDQLKRLINQINRRG